MNALKYADRARQGRLPDQCLPSQGVSQHDWYLLVSPRAYFAYVNVWHAVTLLVYAALGARVVWLGRDGPPWQTLLALGHPGRHVHLPLRLR